jgi:PAS domain S-box-containing protein
MFNQPLGQADLVLRPPPYDAVVRTVPAHADAAQHDVVGQWMRASLDALIHLFETVVPGTRGSVLLLDDDGVTLRHGASPNLPEEYCRLIDGEKIGPAAGSCGTAVYRRERVIVCDIATDPLWANYRAVAEPFDLAACWSTPIFGSEGNILGTFAMYYNHPRAPTNADIALTETATLLSANIIQHARTARELRLSHARLRAALDASATSTWEWNMKTDVVDCDDGLFRLFGVDPAQATGSFDLFVSRIHADDRERVIAAARRCASEGTDLDEEFRVVRPDGSVRWVVDRGRVIFDESDPHYLIGACLDITERHLREEERERLLESERQARQGAERATRLRDDVLAVVAHDLRNPVHTIILSTGVLHDIPLDETQRRQRLGVIERTAKGMDHLIGDLLDATRIESGTFDVRRARAHVAALVDDAVESFDAQAKECGITLQRSVSPDLPPVVGDRDRLAQVLSNLIGNALKFTARGGTIRVNAIAGSDDLVEISVADTGNGIPAEQLPHVFDRFWQADRQGRAGAGLGLAIVKGIVEAHGGRIRVASVVGEGTTFSFTIPLAMLSVSEAARIAE